MGSILGKLFFQYTFFFSFYRSVTISKHIAVQYIIKNKRGLTERKLLYRSLLTLFSNNQNAENKALKAHQAAKEHTEGMLYKYVLNRLFGISQNHLINKINKCQREPTEGEKDREKVCMTEAFQISL